jgi:hypothetical protein
LFLFRDLRFLIKQLVVSAVWWLRHPFAISCQLITLVGLIGQARLANGPSEKMLNVNLLDPWLASCVPGASCWGTAWNHWGGPYSIFWYWTNTVLSLNDHVPLTLSMFILGGFIQILLRNSWLAGPFAVNQLFGILAWPQNVVPVWLVFLGFYHWQGLVLSPIWKLPIGSFEAWVWNIAFNSHTALRDSGNWFSYLWLVTLWTIALIVQVRKRRKSSASSSTAGL